MTNVKSVLLVVFFMLATLIGESTAEALQVNKSKSIDQAFALIDKAVDEAFALVRRAIDEDSALTKETIGATLALIEEAIDEAAALITEPADKDSALVDEAINEGIQEAIEAINKEIQGAMKTVACRLVQDEFKVDVDELTGPRQADFAGSLAAGMVSAHELIGDSIYKTSAELAGKSILSAAAGNFTGNEAFALVRLSQISGTPSDNLWRTAVSDFYRNVKCDVDGTEGYICEFTAAGPSTAVFHLAYHVIAAYYVDAEDKQIYRRALITYLAQIDNESSDCPVMALGIATWALSLTGLLDETLIDPAGTAAACWSHKRLKDLPGLLLSQQVPDGKLYAGSFYRRFDHGDGGVGSPLSGYMEDTIFATLGLIGAWRANQDPDLEAAICAARQAILDCIDATGRVRYHLQPQCLDENPFYAGEMLQVLGELIIRRDSN